MYLCSSVIPLLISLQFLLELSCLLFCLPGWVQPGEGREGGQASKQSIRGHQREPCQAGWLAARRPLVSPPLLPGIISYSVRLVGWVWAALPLLCPKGEEKGEEGWMDDETLPALACHGVRLSTQAPSRLLGPDILYPLPQPLNSPDNG